jgi:FkbM family methyltransferase
MPDTYRFANGITVRRVMLLTEQLERYAAPGNPNLHEPVEEEQVLAALDECGASPVFVDVGAGIGYYTALVLLHRPLARVVSVEPLARHAAEIPTTLALSGVSSERVEILELAVAPEEGEALLTDMSYGSTLLPAVTEQHARAVSVQVATLAGVVGVRTVDLLKMDIQRAEDGVLGASRPLLCSGRVARLIVGTHSGRHEAVATILSRCGYRIILDDPAPPMQPDGIVVASYEYARSARSG